LLPVTGPFFFFCLQAAELKLIYFRGTLLPQKP